MEKEVKIAINNWGLTLSDKRIKDFGDRIAVLKIEEAFHNEFFLTNQYRSEVVENYIAPYKKGESIGDWYSKGELRISLGDFTRKTHEVVVSGSEKIGKCDACNDKPSTECKHCRGNGKETCGGCKGHGTIKCFNCSGKGSIVCLRCGGTGQKYLTEFINGQLVSRWRNCDYCGGSRYTICEFRDCSNGRFDCPACDSYGHRDCSVCSGVGKTYCSKCKGSGQRIEFSLKTVKVDYRTLQNGFEPSGFSAKFPNFRLSNKKKGNRILEEITQNPNRDTFNDEDRLCVRAYKELYDKSDNLDELDIDDDCEIIFQKFVQIQHPLYEVTYKLGDNNYILIFNEFDKSIHAEKIPDILTKKGLVKTILEKIKGKDDRLWVLFFAVIALFMLLFAFKQITNSLNKQESNCTDVDIVTKRKAKLYAKPNLESTADIRISKNDTLTAKCIENYKYFYEINFWNEKQQAYEVKYVYKEDARKISE